jgi:hypothetical protein
MLGVHWVKVAHLGNIIALSHDFLFFRVEITARDLCSEALCTRGDKTATVDLVSLREG